MAERVYYIPANTDTPAEIPPFFSTLLEIIQEDFPNDCGFLKLVNYKSVPNARSMQQLPQSGNDVYYYGRALGAVVGNLEMSGYWRELDWSDPDRRNSLLFMEQRTGDFWDSVLHREDYNCFLKDWESSFPNRSFPKQQIAYIDNGCLTIAAPLDGFLTAYYIRLHRCGVRDWNVCIANLMAEGLLPVVNNGKYRELIDTPQFWDWLNTFNFSDSVQSAAQPAEQPPNDEAIRSALEHFKTIDYDRARIPRYTDQIFQVDEGCWDLTPYVKYDPGNPPPKDSPVKWLNLSGWNQEIYAKDPREDIAASDEWAAIDFGTKSTSVAVWEKSGIHMRRIGMQDENIYADDDDNEIYENPTILCFESMDAFLAAYRSSPGRPDTKFDQIPVAKEAQEAFKQVLDRSADNPTVNINDMMKYQEQLKQWADNSSRSIYIKYTDNTSHNLKSHELKYASLPADAPDPVEIYAYYIGLYLNNMHNKKIYMKYLLSFSATYFKGNLDKIQQSFIRGLKKSLPAEIAADEDLMKNFEVRLYMDEATAYAVAAILRYRSQAAIKERNQWQPAESERVDLPPLAAYTEAMSSGGVFYGVYDFGGGTLDYSYGLMMRSQKGKDVIEPLERGGASNAGCENILEELAYKIFWENRKKMVDYQIPFLAAPTLSSATDFPWIKTTPAAHFNTLQLIGKLRKAWVDNTFKVVDSFRLMSESEKKDCFFDVTLKPPGDKTAQTLENNLVLELKEDIKAFFQKEIEAGIKNFLWQFEYTAAKHHLENRPRFIFLGGNASRSKMVLEIFQKMTNPEEKNTGINEEMTKKDGQIKYCLHPALPTSYDKELTQKRLDASYPTAKSGVVHGMLLARPHVNGIQVCQSQLPYRYFKYHLGCWAEDDIFFTDGFFELMASASDLRPDTFRCLGQIPMDGGFNLYYSQKPELGFKREGAERMFVADASVTTVCLGSHWGGKYLYGCPVTGSDTDLELWVSLSQNVSELTEDHMPEIFAGVLSLSSTTSFSSASSANSDSFDAESVCVRFSQDTVDASEIFAISELPTRGAIRQDMSVDRVAFWPGTGMCIQYGSRSELEADRAKEFAMPADFYPDESDKKTKIYCCRTETPSARLLLIAYRNNQVVGEFRVNLLSKPPR